MTCLEQQTIKTNQNSQGADIVLVMVSAALVLQIIPAIAIFYSGAADRSSTLTLLRMPVITAAFCSSQVR